MTTGLYVARLPHNRRLTRGEMAVTRDVGVAVFAVFAVFAVMAACGRRSSPEPYAPGLGEMMSLQQMRHAKLWLAGEAENWELADYELDEIGEGFDDIVTFHPTHKDSPVAPKDAIPRMVTEPLKLLRGAVDKKDAAAFAQAYDALTAACNSCHQA